MKNVLIIAAHPDDEVLGCGGAIARHSRQGDTVHVLILAEGLTSRTGGESRNLSALADSAQAANNILGVASLNLSGLPDNRMDGQELLDVVKIIEGHVDRVQPDTVFSHHGGDVNIDHRITHQAVVTACRPLPESSVRELLFFETPSSTEWQPPGSSASFEPGCFINISADLETKMNALECYASEMREWPHSRSYKAVRALAQWRGATVGVEAAEAFMVGRYLRD